MGHQRSADVDLAFLVSDNIGGFGNPTMPAEEILYLTPTIVEILDRCKQQARSPVPSRTSGAKRGLRCQLRTRTQLRLAGRRDVRPLIAVQGGFACFRSEGAK